MRIKLQFEGGVEMLMNNIKEHNVELPANTADNWSIRNLLGWIKENLITDRAELFVQNGTVRPGIIVLVNDVDWELLDTVDYRLQPDDTVTFISTLHGG